MKKIIITLIVLALFGVGAYYFLTQLIGGGSRITCGDGFRFDPSKNTCVEVEIPDEKKELDFTTLEIRIPESSTKVKLEKSGDNFVGTYSESPISSFANTVLINPSDMTVITDTLVLIPMTIDSGGTGQFVYIGLFDKAENKHLSSIFVGDRIPLGQVDVKDDIVKINYKTRTLSQNFAEPPTVPAQLVLSVKDGSMSEMMRLQNSDYSEVEIRSPYPNSPVSGNVSIKGSVPGSWYFEAITGYKILDKNHVPISEGTIQALSDWMTTQRVPFQLDLNTNDLGYAGQATLVIESENVQGDEEGELKVKRLEFPFVIK